MKQQQWWISNLRFQMLRWVWPATATTELDAKSREFCSTAHPSLAKDKLMFQMFLRKCGLVVDPKWGNADLLFPFGVYEAKRNPIHHEEAKSQVYHAATTYLSMLDDLARNPRKLAEYQTPDSDKYQIFGFTSAGPQWRAWVGYNPRAGQDKCVSKWLFLKELVTYNI